MIRAHLSIHDVAPTTLKQVERMIHTLKGWGMPRTMLLVIPGLPWTEGELDTVRGWESEGHLLAGHGWVHRVSHPKTIAHKIHSALISRDVAEHLSLEEEEIAGLMERNHAWFQAHGFPGPSHYVPPAWALGRISRKRLQTLPFDTIEVLQGIIDTSTGILHRMPLVGYEADTAFRAWFLRGFNRWNFATAQRTGRCVRISLHPYDLEYRLKDRIQAESRGCAMVSELPCSPV